MHSVDILLEEVRDLTDDQFNEIVAMARGMVAANKIREQERGA